VHGTAHVGRDERLGVAAVVSRPVGHQLLERGRERTRHGDSLGTLPTTGQTDDGTASGGSCAAFMVLRCLPNARAYVAIEPCRCAVTKFVRARGARSLTGRGADSLHSIRVIRVIGLPCCRESPEAVSVPCPFRSVSVRIHPLMLIACGARFPR
jgi:hypothetical protein